MNLEFDSFSRKGCHCVYPSSTEAHLHHCVTNNNQITSIHLFCFKESLFNGQLDVCMRVIQNNKQYLGEMETPPMQEHTHLICLLHLS